MKYSLVILMLMFVMNSQAQNINFKSLKPELFATTGMGVSNLNAPFKNINNNGFKTYTGVELQMLNHYWARASYEVSLYGFNKSAIQNGFRVNIKGNKTFLAGFIDVGYRQEINNFAIYGFGGFGVGSLSVPDTKLNTATQEVNSEMLNKAHLALRTGIGIELEIKPAFIPFAEFQYSTFTERTYLNDRNLLFSNILFGFKARLKRKS